MIGRNNLITLNNIILPDRPYITNFSLSGDITQFNDTYSIEQLKRVMDNWMLSSISDTTQSGLNINAAFVDISNSTEKKTETNMEAVLRALQKRRYFGNEQLVMALDALESPTPPAIKTTDPNKFFTDNHLTCLRQFKIIP
jgi:hypothetical protein